jgi:hypothetical protein
VYVEPLGITGELQNPAADPGDPAEPAHLITQLRQDVARLRPVPAARHSSPAMFVHNDLHYCTEAFLRQDSLRCALEPLYNGPYQVLSRREKMKLLVLGKTVTVSTDRVKPAYILKEADCRNTPSNGYPASTVPLPPPTPTQTTRSCRHVRFPVRFNT